MCRLRSIFLFLIILKTEIGNIGNVGQKYRRVVVWPRRTVWNLESCCENASDRKVAIPEEDINYDEQKSYFFMKV